MSPALLSSSRPSAPPTRRVFVRRLAHFWWTHQWPILITLWVAMLVLGYVGFWRYYQEYPHEAPHAPGDLVYYTMQLVPMISGALPHEVPLELEIARHALPLVEGYAGVIAAVIAISGGTLLLRLAGARDHVVICGLGRKGALLARRFRELGSDVVLVERRAEEPLVAECRDAGLPVLIGDATQPEVLRRARIGRAASLIAVCGDDATNAGILMSLQQQRKSRRGRPVLCALHIVDPRLCELLLEREFDRAFADTVRLELFNIYALGAREVLFEQPPLRPDPTRPPHLLVVGLGPLGRNLIVRLALDWQPTYRSTGQRLPLSVLAPDVEPRLAALQQRYPRLAEICELCPCSVDLHAVDYQCASVLRGDGHEGEVTTAYVCPEDGRAALAAGLTLAHDVRSSGAKVVAVVEEEDALVAFAQARQQGGQEESAVERLDVFPLLERTCTPAVVLGGAHETLARAIHEEYVRRQSELGETLESNPALAPWEALPERLQDANRSQADHIAVKLAAAGYDLEPLTDWDADRFTFSAEEVERLARLEHERWVADYLDAGWRQAEGGKDAQAKTHPSLVAWEDLPGSEREKDRNAVRRWPPMLARAGLQIVPREPTAAGA